MTLISTSPEHPDLEGAKRGRGVKVVILFSKLRIPWFMRLHLTIRAVNGNL
jgi:hypothetical protein